MQDHAKAIRSKLIAETPEDTPLEIKRRVAIAKLGENYVLHPEYKYRVRHNFSPAIWQPHAVLRPIQLAAMQAGRI